jgi:voltage-gated potassium channel
LGFNSEEREDLLRRIDRATDLPLTLLSGLFVAALILPVALHMDDQKRSTFIMIEAIVWAAFAADLIVKLVIAPRRLSYIRSHLLDVAIVLLPMIRPLRALRVLRVLLALTAGGRGIVGARRLLGRHGLGYTMLVAMAMVFLGGALVTEAEIQSNHSNIQNFGDGLWWAITTMTTIGEGDRYPVTVEGRGVGVVLGILGIVVFGIVAANLSALFIDAEEHRLTERLTGIEERLASLEGVLLAVSAAVEERRTMVESPATGRPDVPIVAREMGRALEVSGPNNSPTYPPVVDSVDGHEQKQKMGDATRLDGMRFGSG